jgi:hypothetical protein
MRKLSVFGMTIVFLAFMGMSVSAVSDEVKPVDGSDTVVNDETTPEVDGEDVTNPCGGDIEVCIFSEGSGEEVTEVKVCTIDEKGNESCESVPVEEEKDSNIVDVKPIDDNVDEIPVDCKVDPTICQRDSNDQDNVAPVDGEYEEGIYYLTGAKDLNQIQDTGMVTVSVIGSTLGLIILGFALNRKIKKN